MGAWLSFLGGDPGCERRPDVLPPPRRTPTSTSIPSMHAPHHVEPPATRAARHPVLFSVPTPAVRTPRFRCDRCDQSYPTSEALASHKRAMHPPVRTVSGERFSSQSAHNQHRVHTRHGDEEDLPAPPVDSPGKWIPRAQFKGRKSFGHFQCPKCHKWWNSAFAFPDKKQACKECETWNHPVYLWLNSSLEPRQPRADISDTPHDGSRCEACQSGVPCTARAFSRPQR